MIDFKRPVDLSFALDFLGDPEAAALIAYMERLERELYSTSAALAAIMLDLPGAFEYLKQYSIAVAHPTKATRRVVDAALAGWPE